MHSASVYAPVDEAMLESMLPQAVELVGRFLEADLAGVSVLVDNRALLKTSICSTQSPDQEPWVDLTPLSADNSLSAYSVEQDAAIVVSDMEAEERFHDRFLLKLGVARAMVVPITVEETVVGVLGTYWIHPRTFLPEDVEAADAIALLLATRISRVQTMSAGPGATGDHGASTLSDTAEEGDAYTCAATPTSDHHRTEAYDYRVTAPSGGDEAVPPEIDAIMKDLVGEHWAGGNRRSSARVAYKAWQPIAPLHGTVMPSLQQFFPVECCDLSNGGISFYADVPPEFKTFVIGLGEPPDLKFFTARIVRVVGKQHNGRTRHLIGCQFLGRVHL